METSKLFLINNLSEILENKSYSKRTKENGRLPDVALNFSIGKEVDSTNYTQMLPNGNTITTLLNEPGDMNLNSTFYLTQNIIISSCHKYKKLMRYFHLFCSTSSKSNGYFIFYTTFKIEPATFQVLCRHMWFLLILDCAATDLQATDISTILELIESWQSLRHRLSEAEEKATALATACK